MGIDEIAGNTTMSTKQLNRNGRLLFFNIYHSSPRIIHFTKARVNQIIQCRGFFVSPCPVVELASQAVRMPAPMATTTLRLSETSSAQKRTLIAAALGWGLDGFDVLLYSLVQLRVMESLGLHPTDPHYKAISGLPTTFMLLASGIGGVLFGFIADRIGRKKALMLSILTYSVCSFASGLATSVAMLAGFRFILGLGMGGEWNTGATLVAETWPTELRAKAISIVQSSW